MLIYNITVRVEQAIADEWLDWMLRVHIPEVMQTGCFVRYQLLKLLEQDESGGPTYVVQYYASSLEKYQEFLSHRKEFVNIWTDQIVSFRTIMEVLK
jgi:hypothetical protein